MRVNRVATWIFMAFFLLITIENDNESLWLFFMCLIVSGVTLFFDFIRTHLVFENKGVRWDKGID